MNQNPRVLGNRYEVGDLLGRGGMAEVHLGRDTRLGRVVAIKLLRVDLARDPIFQARFRREAQSSAGLNHPAIVAVYDTGEETVTESGGSTIALPYIVMEHVEGRTLRELLRDGKPLEVHQALEITAGVLAALDYSHRMGIVHRDIKPANVMLTPNGDVKVMDFGIARALADVSATMTQTHAVIGTAQYLSPEQARGETVDARSDLYSAGCLLYELMTGRPPFVADSPVAVAYQHVREAPHPPSAFNPLIPEVVDRVVLHALAKDREARYQTAADFRADLEAALAGRAVTAATVALGAAQGQAGTATEYIPQAPGGTRSYPALGQTATGAPASAPGGYPGYDQGGYQQGGYQQGGYDQGGYDQGGYQQGGYDQGGGDGYPPEPAYRGRRADRTSSSGQGEGNRSLGFVLLALAVIALFAGAAYLVRGLVANNSTGPKVAIPVVAGLLQADAETKLRAQKFTNYTITTRPADQPQKGRAIGTDPAAGKPVHPTDPITLIISGGPSTKAVPNVKGKSEADAKAALIAAGFKVGFRESVDNSGLDQGKVVSTDPAIGSAVAPGAQITLRVSSGKFKIPDVTQKTDKDAEALLNSKGIPNSQIKVVIQFTDSAAANTVIDQDPKANTIVPALQRVTLTVAKPASEQPSQQPSGGGDGGNSSGNGSPTESGGNGDGGNGQSPSPSQ